MKRFMRFAGAVAAAVAVAPLASATPRSGTLQVDKECSHYDGLPVRTARSITRTSPGLR